MKKILLISFFIIYLSQITNAQNNLRLIAWWPFDDATARDYSGNGYDGQLINSPKLVPGKDGEGYAFEFKGYGINTSQGSYIKLPWIDFYSFKEFTISFWAKFKSLSYEAGEAYFFFGDHSNGWLGIMNHVRQPQYDRILYVQFSVGSDLNYGQNRVFPIEVQYNHNYDNKWVHYMLTYKDSILSAYIDSNLVGSKKQAIHIVGKKGGVATHYWTGGGVSTRLNGVIDDIRIYAASCDKTAFDYPDFSNSDGIDFIESASNSNPTITLTPSNTWTVGAIWNKEKIPVQNGFTTSFEFRFSEGQDKYQNEKYPGADGIAFVIQNFYDKAYGSVGEGIGYAGIPNSFAIEFDTYKNFNQDQYIVLSGINDPNENHLAVFCNGLFPNIARHGSIANLATNDTIMDLVPDGRSFYVKIDYNIEPNIMKIWLDSTKDFLNPPAIILNNLDLSQLLDLTCNEFAWVGFTSATGRAYEKHEILSWSLCPNPTSTIIPHPRITTGADTVCGKQIAQYTSNLDYNIIYHWVVENGTILEGQNTRTVTVKWGENGYGLLKLSQTIIGGCSDTAKKYVTIMPSPDTDIEGEHKVCKGNTLIFKCKDLDYVNNKWEISGANIIGDNTGNKISVSFDTVGSAIVTLVRENFLTMCADTSQITITVNSLPSPEIIEGKNPVYPNKGYEYVSNDEPDVNINWIVEGGEIVSGQSEKKVIIQWFTEGNGKIQLVHYNHKTGCSNIITKYIKIISNPDIEISGSKDACIEMVYTYSVSDSTEYYYKWMVDNGDIIGQDNKNFVNIIWHKEGINSIRLLTVNKSNDLKDTITLSVNVHSLPVIVFNDMPDICLNDEPLELNFATPTGGNYYGDGVNSNIFYPKEAGVGNHEITYIYTEPKTLCKNSGKNNIFVLPIPEQPKISQNGKVLVSSSAFEYQWYSDGEKIEGATNQQYKPLKTGYYSVVVSDENGCKSKISEPFFFDISDVEDDINATNSIRILPNPANDILYIELNKDFSFMSCDIKIINLLGNTVLEKTININNNQRIKLDISLIPAGYYMVLINSGANSLVKKVIIY